MGYEYATKAGISINVNDMMVPDSKAGYSWMKLTLKLIKLTKEYNEGSITNGERYNKIVDVWAHTN